MNCIFHESTDIAAPDLPDTMEFVLSSKKRMSLLQLMMTTLRLPPNQLLTPRSSTTVCLTLAPTSLPRSLMTLCLFTLRIASTRSTHASKRVIYHASHQYTVERE